MAMPKKFRSPEKVSRGPRNFFAAGIAMVNTGDVSLDKASPRANYSARSAAA
jgi:hypothetical protein